MQYSMGMHDSEKPILSACMARAEHSKGAHLDTLADQGDFVDALLHLLLCIPQLGGVCDRAAGLARRTDAPLPLRDVRQQRLEEEMAILLCGVVGCLSTGI